MAAEEAFKGRMYPPDSFLLRTFGTADLDVVPAENLMASKNGCPPCRSDRKASADSPEPIPQELVENNVRTREGKDWDDATMTEFKASRAGLALLPNVPMGCIRPRNSAIRRSGSSSMRIATRTAT